MCIEHGSQPEENSLGKEVCAGTHIALGKDFLRCILCAIEVGHPHEDGARDVIAGKVDRPRRLQAPQRLLESWCKRGEHARNGLSAATGVR